MRRTEYLTATELKQFRKKIDGADTVIDAADGMGMHRATVYNIYNSGTVSGRNIAKVRKFIKS